MIFLWIYLGISVLTLIVEWFYVGSLKQQIQEQCSDEYINLRKHNLNQYSIILAYLKILLSAFCPLVHLFILGGIIFLSDEIDRQVITKINQQNKQLKKRKH